MTDRYAGFVVTLDHDVRSDDAEPIIAAIRHLRGVVNVEPVTSNAQLHLAFGRARAEIADRLMSALYPSSTDLTNDPGNRRP